jgi:GDSL-like Lipase/Acylhydrolase family
MPSGVNGNAPLQRTRPRFLRVLTAVAVVVACVLSVAGGTAAAAVSKRITATFIYMNNSSGDSCGWGIGIKFPKVPHASGYVVKYWDGYWKQNESATVTPKQVVPNTFTGGENFMGVTGGSYSPPCATESGGDPTEGGRFSKGAKAWALFPKSYEPPDADGIDWTMPPRLGVASGPYGLPSTKELFPKSWQARIFPSFAGAPAQCGGTTRWRWTVDVPAGVKLLSGKPKPGCTLFLESSKLGTLQVSASEERLRKGTWRATGPPLRQAVALRDYVIVGLGDSNGSGEGNTPFYYPRCDRSEASYQYRTALYVEQQDPRSSVTFVHAACSGARIDHLFSTPYQGIYPEASPLKPQIEQVIDRLSDPGPKRKVDAVIVSAGVNDLAFGPLMAYCVASVAYAPNTPCEGLSTTPVLDAGGRVADWKEAASGPTLADGLATLQAQLPGRYPALASALGSLGVPAKKVFITQYPDFTNGDDGKSCGPTGVAAFSTSTWTFLGLNAALLNRTIATAAKQNGWTLAPVNAGAFATRGYCSSKSLFAGIVETSLVFDDAGPFHPNRDAHDVQAAEVEPLLCASLGTGATCDRKV